VSVVEKAVAKLKSSASGADAARQTTMQRQSSAGGQDGAAPARRPVAPIDPARHVQLQLDGPGFVPEPAQQRRISQEYGTIKRPILDRIADMSAQAASGARFVMMASALPGDGKTFSSFHLAASIARERDVSVLLVDADVARPSLSRALGIADRPGLLDALANDAVDIESCVLSTDVPGLYLLSAGQSAETSAELLASHRMIDVVNRLEQADPARIVVIDSSPLLLSSESRILVQLAGQIVLVVLAGVTSQRAVRDAVAAIPSGKLTGLVLNERNSSTAGGKYGHGDYGDYGKTGTADGG